MDSPHSSSSPDEQDDQELLMFIHLASWLDFADQDGLSTKDLVFIHEVCLDYLAGDAPHELGRTLARVTRDRLVLAIDGRMRGPTGD